MTAHDKNGNEMSVAVRTALPVNSPCARYTGFKPETVLLKKGSIRLKGYMPLPCDIILERDVPVKLRDGVTIYTDIFRTNDHKPHHAIMAMSPCGKEIGSQWLDDTPNHAGIPMEATSGLQKFEGPDPAYWCNHGYAVINPDVRGAYNSEGIILFFGSDYGRDGADIIEWAAKLVQRQNRYERKLVACYLAVVCGGAEAPSSCRYCSVGVAVRLLPRNCHTGRRDDARICKNAFRFLCIYGKWRH